MKRQFARLSKGQQEKVEAEYHRMKPKDFDEAMARAKKAPARGQVAVEAQK